MSKLPDFILIEAPLAGLAILPFLGVGVASLVLFWTCHDPARSGFKWLGTASLSLGIYAALDLAMALQFRFSDPSDVTVLWLPLVTMFFRNIAYIQLFAVLVGVAVGVHRVAAATAVVTSDNHTPSRFRKIVRGSMYAAVGLLNVMVVLEFALRAVLTPANSMRTPLTRKLFVPLGVAVHMLLLVAFIVALGLAVYVFSVARKAQMSGDVHKFLLAAAVLAWARAMIYLGPDILALTPRPDWGSGLTAWQAAQAALRRQFASAVLALIGDFVLSLTAVILLFVAGRRKTGGLWSSPQAQAGVASKSKREHSPGV